MIQEGVRAEVVGIVCERRAKLVGLACPNGARMLLAGCVPCMCAPLPVLSGAAPSSMETLPLALSRPMVLLLLLWAAPGLWADFYIAQPARADATTTQ